MRDEAWLKTEITRMNRGTHKIRDILKHSIFELETSVLSGNFEQAYKIVDMRHSLRKNLQSVMDRRVLLLKILNPKGLP